MCSSKRCFLWTPILSFIWHIRKIKSAFDHSIVTKSLRTKLEGKSAQALSRLDTSLLCWTALCEAWNEEVHSKSGTAHQQACFNTLYNEGWQNKLSCWVWQRTSLTPVLRRRRQAKLCEFWCHPGIQSEFQDNQGYTIKPYLQGFFFLFRKHFMWSVHVSVFVCVYAYRCTCLCVHV